MCDVDFDYFGCDDFYDIGCIFFEEFKVFNVFIFEEVWNCIQVSFLE